jgi:DNA-binding LacI/PurR family transcriptional regulator
MEVVTVTVSSLYEVASRVGVSAATVSRALRGLPGVCASTRARIVAAAAELEYAISPGASRLASDPDDVADLLDLTTVRQPVLEQGEGAARLLLDLLATDDPQPPRRPVSRWCCRRR